MVRVVSQNFSPPRSRHSSGETDRDLAERANLALSALGRKRFDAPEYESSSDSFWDSEFDGDQCEAHLLEKDDTNDDINGNETSEKSDVQSKRKERRRERNKLSAQAYRQRRRSQSVKEQQTLMDLEAENKRLHRIVETLEKKKESVKHMLRGCSHPMVLQPIGEQEGATADMSDTDADLTLPRSAVPLSSQMCASCSSNGPVPLPLQSNPNLTLPLPNFIKKSAQTTVKHEPHRKIPSFTENKTSTCTYLTTGQPSPALCPSIQPNHLILNTNVLVGATLSPSGMANLTTVPAILAVPIETQKHCYPNSNMNCNPLRTGLDHTANALTYPEKETRHTKLDSTPVFNTVWWSGNRLEPRINSETGTIIGLGSMEVSNNSMNNNSINGNDANGNNSCDRNISMQPQPVSFNLNLNQAAGVTGQELISPQIQFKHPAMSVKCFLTPADQVPVQ